MGSTCILPSSALRPIADRLERAERAFLTYLEEQHALTPADAALVARIYLNARILRLCPAMGQWTVTHGALLNDDVIQRALEHAKTTNTNEG